MGRKKTYDYEAEKTKVTYGNERLDPNSEYNKKQNFTPQDEEVNPEVREEFEAKYGKGAKFGKTEGKRAGMGAESEEAYLQKIKEEHEKGKGWDKNIPIYGPLKENITLMGDKDLRKAHSTKEIIANQGALVGETALAAAAIYGGETLISGLGKGAMVGGAFGKGSAGYAGVNGLLPEAKLLSTGNILSKGLKLAGSPAGKLALAGITADQLTNWFASDNVITGASVNIQRLYSQMGSATPEQREKLIESAENQKHIADLAKAKVVISGIINPTNWIMGEPWIIGSNVPIEQMQTYLNAMRQYNPLMDDFSQESKQAKEKKNLQTYGKPKYDEQGNPLYY